MADALLVEWAHLPGLDVGLDSATAGISLGDDPSHRWWWAVRRPRDTRGWCPVAWIGLAHLEVGASIISLYPHKLGRPCICNSQFHERRHEERQNAQQL